jgi:chorismate mutase
MIFNSNKLIKPLIIAGPCSAESQEQVLTTAKNLSTDISIFRAGVWKPRTRPNTFEGIGEPALEWLKEVQNQTHLKVATEVATPEHVEKCLKANIDVLWIGARTTVNPFYVQEIAEALKGVDATVMVKNPLHPELSLWMGAIERLMMIGIKDIAAIHRGFFTLEQSVFRNEPKWELAIKLKRMHPELPIICDPSHISGSPNMIKEVSQTAMDLNMDGLMIETHYNPKVALSDAQQQITPSHLNQLIQSLVLRTEMTHNQFFNSHLNVIRQKIDSIDNELINTIAKRTDLVNEI